VVDWFQHLAMRPAVTDKVQVEPRGVQPLLRQRLARLPEESVKGVVRLLGDEVVARTAEQRHGELGEERSATVPRRWRLEQPSVRVTGTGGAAAARGRWAHH
jgi:hypothetical protein